MNSFFFREYTKMMSFVKTPTHNSNEEGLKNKITLFGFVFLIDSLLLLFNILLFYIVYLLGFKDILDNNSLIDLLKDTSLTSFVISAVFIFPFLEELLFRFHLKFRNKFVNIYLPLCFIFLSFLTTHYLIILLVLAIILYVSFIINGQVNKDNYQSIWKKRFKLIFYSSSFLFALLHLGNYNLSSEVLLISPLLILPQFLGGIMIGYIRVKSGFLWGLLLHIISNAILMVPIIIGITTSIPSFEINKQEYQLEVENLGLKENTHRYKEINLDVITIENYNFIDCLSFLLDVEKEKILINETYFSFGIPKLRGDLLLKIHYKKMTKKSETREAKNNILFELQKEYKFKIKENKDGVEIHFE